MILRYPPYSMNIVQRVAKNTALLFIARLVSALFIFIYMVHAARYLGPRSFGILTFALTFTAIFGIFTDFGLQLLMVREIARDKSLTSKYLANVSLIKIILSAAAFLLITLIINYSEYSGQTVQSVYLIGLSVILTTVMAMFYSVFNAHERMEYQSRCHVLNAALMLCRC